MFMDRSATAFSDQPQVLDARLLLTLYRKIAILPIEYR